MSSPFKGVGKVDIPYGAPSLVVASKRLVDKGVLGDVTKVVKLLHSAGQVEFSRFVTRQQSANCSQVGVLDGSFDCPENLDDTTLVFKLLSAEEKEMVNVECGFTGGAALGSISLTIKSITCTDPYWTVWAQLAAREMLGAWDLWFPANSRPQLKVRQLRSSLIANFHLAEWSADRLAGIPTLGGGCELFDSVEDCKANGVRGLAELGKVYLVTPALAEALEKVGAIAGTVMGLPLWSTEEPLHPAGDLHVQAAVYESIKYSKEQELANPAPL